MGSIGSSPLSIGWHTVRQIVSTAAQAPFYVRIVPAAAVFMLSVPLWVGIYESWRKKQITNIYIQDFSNSLNPIKLYLLGVRELRSSHWSSSLETMDFRKVVRIDFEKLSLYQLSLLGSRSDVVDQLHSAELYYLYRNTTIPKKEWVGSLTGRQLVALLNHQTFSPDAEFGTFDLPAISPSEAAQIPIRKLSAHQLDALVDRPDIVRSLLTSQHCDLYQRTTKKKQLIESLTGRQLLNLLKHSTFAPDAAFGTFDLSAIPSSEAREIPTRKLSTPQLDALVCRLDVAPFLNPDAYLYAHTTKKKELVSSLKGPKLVALLNDKNFKPDTEFGTFNLSAIPPSEANRVPFFLLSQSQLDALLDRAEIVNELSPTSLCKFYKATGDKKAFVLALPARQLRALLNEENFTPGKESTATFESTLDSRTDLRLGPSKLRATPPDKARTIQLEKLTRYQLKILMSRSEVVHQFNPGQLLLLYQQNTMKDENFVASFSVQQLLGLLLHRSFQPRQGFYDLVAIFRDLVNALNPDQLAYFFRKVSNTRGFVTGLTSSPLVDLLNHSSFSLSEVIDIFDMLLPNQFQHVEIFEKFCSISSMRLCSMFFGCNKQSRMQRFIPIPHFDQQLQDLISTTKAKIASIPLDQIKYFLSTLPLNQFTLLFFSDDHLSSIDFKKAQFTHIQCQDLGISHHLSLEETSPQKWLEDVCRLFNEGLVEDRILWDIREVRLPEAETQLQKLSPKQVAFLDRRVSWVRHKDRVFSAVFLAQLRDPKYSAYKAEFDTTDTETVIIPKLSVGEAYQILGLKDTASWDEIKTKYRKMALTLHPDRADDKEQAKAKFQQLQEAYKLLEKIKKPKDSNNK